MARRRRAADPSLAVGGGRRRRAGRRLGGARRAAASTASLVALNRSPGRPVGCACPTRARTRRGASFSTPTTIPSSTPRRRSPTGCASPPARRSRSPKSTRRRRACARRRRARSNSLAEAAGIAGDWWDVTGRADHRFGRDQARAAGGVAPARRDAGAGAREPRQARRRNERAAPADDPRQPPRRAAPRAAARRPGRAGGADRRDDLDRRRRHDGVSAPSRAKRAASRSPTGGRSSSG